ncbi:MAG: hypothetical protein ACLR6B_11665 [Blautia sp.]
MYNSLQSSFALWFSQGLFQSARRKGRMDNSLKIITVAIGAVIACLVASIALFVFNVSTRGTSTPSYAVEEMNDSTNGEELSALVSNDTSGDIPALFNEEIKL